MRAIGVAARDRRRCARLGILHPEKEVAATSVRHRARRSANTLTVVVVRLTLDRRKNLFIVEPFGLISVALDDASHRGIGPVIEPIRNNHWSATLTATSVTSVSSNRKINWREILWVSSFANRSASASLTRVGRQLEAGSTPWYRAPFTPRKGDGGPSRLRGHDNSYRATEIPEDRGKASNVTSDTAKILVLVHL